MQRYVTSVLMLLVLLLLVVVTAPAHAAKQTFATTLLVTFGSAVHHRSSSPTSCVELRPIAETQRHRAVFGPNDAIERRRPRERDHETRSPVSHDEIIEIIGGSVAAVERLAKRRCPRRQRRPLSHARALRSMAAPSSSSSSSLAEVRKLVDSGDPANRLDIVFMGDGYTTSERDKFFGDIQRLTDELFAADTFAPYLPLFNVWVAFVPSVDSGIGLDGRPKNTAFQLFRGSRHELRGLATADPQAARDVCQSIGPHACDFPALIANDDYYGGLGGEFVITTRSPTTGTLALRHEFGHNFGRVGEEYDGGQVYVGANWASDASNITWAHWLTDPSRRQPERMAQLFEQRMWHDLSQGPLRLNFTSTGGFRRRRIEFSLTGIRSSSAMSISLDGESLGWTATGVIDRSFYAWTDRDAGFSAGTHELVFDGAEPFSDNGPVAPVVCSVAVVEFMGEDEFKLDDPEYIGIYPTFDVDHVRSYRPSHEKCIMRNVTSTTFCNVCKENLWLQLMERIEFIDDVVVAPGTGNVSVQVVPLGQRRLANDTFLKTNARLAAEERYAVSWFRGTQELTEYRDRFEVPTAQLAAGEYTVRVNLTTLTVRRDPNGYMHSTRSFRVRGDGSVEPSTQQQQQEQQPVKSESRSKRHLSSCWLVLLMGLLSISINGVE
ncbi:hypothetical protein PINS_up014352 [Pythium insidiosum]|nr:hypothetical protein PINS_up014352 [Pythium insidiosum]